MWQIDEIANGNLIDHLISGSCVDCDAVSNGQPISSSHCVTQPGVS